MKWKFYNKTFWNFFHDLNFWKLLNNLISNFLTIFQQTTSSEAIFLSQTSPPSSCFTLFSRLQIEKEIWRLLQWENNFRHSRICAISSEWKEWNSGKFNKHDKITYIKKIMPQKREKKHSKLTTICTFLFFELLVEEKKILQL